MGSGTTMQINVAIEIGKLQHDDESAELFKPDRPCGLHFWLVQL